MVPTNLVSLCGLVVSEHVQLIHAITQRYPQLSRVLRATDLLATEARQELVGLMLVSDTERAGAGNLLSPTSMATFCMLVCRSLTN